MTRPATLSVFAAMAVSLLALDAEAQSKNAPPPVAQPRNLPADACERLSDICGPRVDAACFAATPEATPPADEPATCQARRDAWLGCYDTVVVQCGPGRDLSGTEQVPIPPLLGTVWTGGDTTGDSYVFRFVEDGVLDYTTDSGTWRTGRWIRTGRDVVISMNGGFAVYVGTLDGGAMTGYADNSRAERWDWNLTRTP